MGFRITTNMMMNSYRYNLQGSTKKLADARDKGLTQRNFNSYAEDPAAATQAFRLRRDYYQTYTQLNNTKNIYSKYNTAWNNLGKIKTDLVDKSAIESAIRGDNGTTGEARRALATVLREDAESLVHALNQKLGDQFIFAGNDGLNVPFEWKDVDGQRTLFYRGINVNSGSVPEPDAATKPAWANDPDNFKENGAPDLEKLGDAGVDLDDPDNKNWITYYNDQANFKMLQDMSEEQLYIDLGMGMAESSPNNPVNGSYFNGALCGLDFSGFGVDGDGDPKNLAMIMREMADIFDTWDEETQSFNPALAKDSAEGLTSKELEDKAYRLLNKMTAARDHLSEQWVELDAKSVFLQSNEERLSTLLMDTNTQILDVEQVDLADAITTFSWQQYCYNAALKIGNQLLSQSLIDYMN